MLKIKVGGVAEHFNLPWQLLLESGRLSSLGIDLQWVDCPGGTGEMTTLLKNGDLDLAVLLTEGVIMDIINGSPTRILNVYVQSSLEWGVHVAFESDGRSMLEDRGLTYAISREGSGSHLMAMVYAKEKGIRLDRMKFREVGSLNGALEAFGKKEVDVFLWEKFTTDPFCNPTQLKRIGQIPTPWPCFVVAVNPLFYEINRSKVDQLLHEVFIETSSFKSNPNASSIVAARYGLTIERAKEWFSSVEWGEGQNLTSQEINTVLKKLRLVGKASAETELKDGQVLI